MPAFTLAGWIALPVTHALRVHIDVCCCCTHARICNCAHWRARIYSSRWYAGSVVANSSSKRILLAAPEPLLLTCAQFAVSLLACRAVFAAPQTEAVVHVGSPQVAVCTR